MARFNSPAWWLVSLLVLLGCVLRAEASPLGARTAGKGPVATLVGNATIMGNGTYPRANFLADGSIIGAYTAFTGTENVLTIVKSTDEGATWTIIGEAARGPSATNDLDNPYVLQLPSGRIVIAYRNHTKTTSGNYTFFRITMSYSDDGGKKWAYLSTPASHPGPTYHGLWEPFLRNAKDDSLQIYYSHELNATNQINLMETSTDGGKKWRAPITVSSRHNARDGMTGVATVRGHNLIAIFESLYAGQFKVHSVTSSDDGNSWGHRKLVYQALGKDNNNAGSPQVANVGGDLVASFMTDEDTSEHSWINGADAKLLTSGDGGHTWGNKLEFSPVQSNWPSLLALGKKTFLGMVDYGGVKAQKMVLS